MTKGASAVWPRSDNGKGTFPGTKQGMLLWGSAKEGSSLCWQWPKLCSLSTQEQPISGRVRPQCERMMELASSVTPPPLLANPQNLWAHAWAELLAKIAWRVAAGWRYLSPQQAPGGVTGLCKQSTLQQHTVHEHCCWHTWAQTLAQL